MKITNWMLENPTNSSQKRSAVLKIILMAFKLILKFLQNNVYGSGKFSLTPNLCSMIFDPLVYAEKIYSLDSAPCNYFSSFTSIVHSVVYFLTCIWYRKYITYMFTGAGLDWYSLYILEDDATSTLVWSCWYYISTDSLSLLALWSLCNMENYTNHYTGYLFFFSLQLSWLSLMVRRNEQQLILLIIHLWQNFKIQGIDITMKT